MEEGARDSEGMVGMLCVQVGRITVFWDETCMSRGQRGKDWFQTWLPWVSASHSLTLGLSQFSPDAGISIESLPQAVDSHPVWLAPSVCRRAQGKCFCVPFWFVVLFVVLL